jgi:hypothetical protein
LSQTAARRVVRHPLCPVQNRDEHDEQPPRRSNMTEVDARPAVETDQAAREASGAHPYGRYLEEFEVGAV